MAVLSASIHATKLTSSTSFADLRLAARRLPGLDKASLEDLSAEGPFFAVRGAVHLTPGAEANYHVNASGPRESIEAFRRSALARRARGPVPKWRPVFIHLLDQVLATSKAGRTFLHIGIHIRPKRRKEPLESAVDTARLETLDELALRAAPASKWQWSASVRSHVPTPPGEEDPFSKPEGGKRLKSVVIEYEQGRKSQFIDIKRDDRGISMGRDAGPIKGEPTAAIAKLIEIGRREKDGPETAAR